MINHGPHCFHEETSVSKRCLPKPRPPLPVAPVPSAQTVATFQAWKEFFPNPSLDAIMGAVCFVTGIRREEFLSHRRQVHLVMARFVYYHLARELTARTYPAIGRFCGMRDHTTVMNGVRRVAASTAYAPVIAAVKKLLGVSE